MPTRPVFIPDSSPQEKRLKRLVIRREEKVQEAQPQPPPQEQPRRQPRHQIRMVRDGQPSEAEANRLRGQFPGQVSEQRRTPQPAAPSVAAFSFPRQGFQRQPTPVPTPAPTPAPTPTFARQPAKEPERGFWGEAGQLALEGVNALENLATAALMPLFPVVFGEGGADFNRKVMARAKLEGPAGVTTAIDAMKKSGEIPRPSLVLGSLVGGPTMWGVELVLDGLGLGDVPQEDKDRFLEGLRQVKQAEARGGIPGAATISEPIVSFLLGVSEGKVNKRIRDTGEPIGDVMTAYQEGVEAGDITMAEQLVFESLVFLPWDAPAVISLARNAPRLAMAARQLAARGLVQAPGQVLPEAGLRLAGARGVAGAQEFDFTTVEGTQKAIQALRRSRTQAKDAGVTESTLKALDDEITSMEEYREALRAGEQEAISPELAGLEEKLAETQIELRVLREPTGGRAPKFGTEARTEFDRIRIEERARGVSRKTKKQLTQEKQVELRTIEGQIESLRASAAAAREAQPQVGAIQAGMGIGERPSQGTLLEGFRGETTGVPLIDAERLQAQAARRAEIAAGQADFFDAALFSRYRQEVPKAAALVEDLLRQGQVDDAIRLLRRHGYEPQSTAVRRLTEFFSKPAAPAPAAARAAAKEPWQMTKREFLPTVTARPVGTRFKSIDTWLKEKGLPANTLTQPIEEAVEIGADILARNEPLSVLEAWWTSESLQRLSAERKSLIGQYLADVPETIQKRAITSSPADQAYVRTVHKRAIRKALSEGKPVPANVLADYPDLAALGAPPTEAVAPRVPEAAAPRAAEAGAPPTPARAPVTPIEGSLEQLGRARSGGKKSGPPRRPAVHPPDDGIPPEAPLLGVERDLEMAKTMVEAGRFGALASRINATPGLNRLLRIVYQKGGIPERIHTPFVAEVSTRASFATRTFASRLLRFEGIDAAFGGKAHRGVKLGLEFLGPEGQRAYPALDTIYDVVQRPSMYQLTEAQKVAIAAIREHTTEFRRIAVDRYGVKVGEFPFEEGGAFLSNIDIAQSTLDEVGGSITTAARVGRGKTRVFPTGYDRWVHDPSFVPATDLRVILGGMDEFLAAASGAEVLKAGLKGLTRLEAVRVTHPALYARMTGLRTRLQNLKALAGRKQSDVRDAVDEFLASNVEDVDLTELRDALDIRVKRGPRAGADVAALNAEIRAVRADIRKIQPAWKAAHLKGYTFVQEGLYRYFPLEDAEVIRALTVNTHNPFLNFVEGVRNIVLNFDLSPLVGVHIPLNAAFDPLGFGRQLAGGLVRIAKDKSLIKPLSPVEFARTVSNDLERWVEFAFMSGRSMTGGTAAEFSGGFLRSIPGYSGANDAMFNLVSRANKRLYDSNISLLEGWGLRHEEAAALSADVVGKAVPLMSPIMAGQSPARAKLLRGVALSISFVTRPTELTLEAATAIAKLGLRQGITVREKLALRMMIRLVVTLETIAVTSNAYSAIHRGTSVEDAVLESLNPNSGKFMSLVFPSGGKIGLGGAFRSLIKAMVPQEVEGSPVPLPFVGIPRWLTGKLTPLLRRQLDMVRNRDFYGNKIMTGEFPVNVLQGIAYEVEGVLPLTAQSAVATWRMGYDREEIATETISQFLGTNYNQETPYQERNVVVQQWAKEKNITLEKDEYGQRGYYSLSEGQRKAFDEEHPDTVEAVRLDTQRKAKLGQEASIRRVTAEELKGRYTAEQLADDEAKTNSNLEPKEWRERRKIRAAELNARRDQLYEGIDTKEPKTPTDRYYAFIDQLKAENNGIMPDEAWETVDLWVAGQTPEDRKYIEENTRLSALTPLVRQHYDAQERLQPYWDLEDKAPAYLTEKAKERWVTQERLALRRRNQEIDFLLLEWGYTTTYQNIQNRLTEWRQQQGAVSPEEEPLPPTTAPQPKHQLQMVR